MRAQTNLVRRGKANVFRKKVPLDLRAHYGCESIRKSLGTTLTPAEAKREVARLSEQYEAEFAAVRRAQATGPVSLTLSMVPDLARAFEANILAADDEQRMGALPVQNFESMARATTDDLEVARAAYARNDTTVISHALSDWLDRLGIDAPPGSAATLQLRRRALEAYLRALQGRSKRDMGDIVHTPQAPSLRALQATVDAQRPASDAPAPRRTSGAPTLQDVVAYWAGTSPKAPRTIMAAEKLLADFDTLHGPVALAEVSKAHFVALRDALLKRVQPATVIARFNLLRAAFTTCLQDDQLGITANPLQYVKVRKGEDSEKARDAFSSEQLQTVFDGAVFTSGERPTGGRGEAAYWAPLIALMTGARLDEILSLRLDGVYWWEGVPVIHFRHRPELGQSLKGKAKNNRRVPLHPELIRLGLEQYAEQQRKRSGSEWLFPDIDRSAKRRSHSSAWGAWFGRYLKARGVKTETLTFHSFRHTFKHFMRSSGIPEDHHDAMTGHSTPEVARRYGSAEGYPVEALQRSVQSLKFGALDLSKVTSNSQRASS